MADNDDWSKDCDHVWVDVYNSDGEVVGTTCSGCGSSK